MRSRLRLAQLLILVGLPLVGAPDVGAQTPTVSMGRVGVNPDRLNEALIINARRPTPVVPTCPGTRSVTMGLWTAAGAIAGWGVFLARGGLVDTSGGVAYRRERNYHLAAGAVIGASYGIWRASRHACA